MPLTVEAYYDFRSPYAYSPTIESARDYSYPGRGEMAIGGGID